MSRNEVLQWLALLAAVAGAIFWAGRYTSAVDHRLAALEVGQASFRVEVSALAEKAQDLRGEPGIAGPQGPAGPPGAKGDSAFDQGLLDRLATLERRVSSLSALEGLPAQAPNLQAHSHAALAASEPNGASSSFSRASITLDHCGAGGWYRNRGGIGCRFRVATGIDRPREVCLGPGGRVVTQSGLVDQELHFRLGDKEGRAGSRPACMSVDPGVTVTAFLWSEMGSVGAGGFLQLVQFDCGVGCVFEERNAVLMSELSR